MAKIGEPTWNYRGSVVINSVDYGQTTQPDIGFRGSSLRNFMPTEVTVDGVHFSYGLSEIFTSAHVDPVRPGAKITGAVDPKWHYGLSTVFHKLVDMIIARTGRLRAAHTWVTATMKKRGRF